MLKMRMILFAVLAFFGFTFARYGARRFVDDDDIRELVREEVYDYYEQEHQKRFQGDHRECFWINGDGIGGTEVYAGPYAGKACETMCRKMKESSNSEINGATYRYVGSLKCWCEIRMTNRSPTSTKYKSCFISKFYAPPPPKFACKKWYKLDGLGKKEKYVGAYRGNRCRDACIELRKTYPAINGVTQRRQGKGHKACYCEFKMKNGKKSSVYETCLIAPKYEGN